MEVTFLTSKQISRAATPRRKPYIPHQHATHPVHQLQRSVPNSHLATPTSTQTSNTCLNTPLTYPLSSLPPSNISSPSALGQSFARNRLAILSCSSHQLPPQLLSDGIRESKKLTASFKSSASQSDTVAHAATRSSPRAESKISSSARSMTAASMPFRAAQLWGVSE